MKSPFHPVGVFLRYLCVSSLALAAIAASAQPFDVPHTLSYQGLLTDASGITPIADGLHTATFTIYADAAGTNRIWWSTFAVQTSKGIFNVTLGGGGQLLPTPMNAPLWLGVAVENGAELRPLTKLAAAPYALGVVDNAVATAKLQDASVTTPKLQDSAVTLAKISTNAVSTVKLQDSAVTARKMGVDYVGHVTLNNKTVATERGKDIDITVGTNLTMTTSKDAAGNIHMVIDAAGGAAIPAGTVVLFPTAGPYAGFTPTGQTVQVGDHWTVNTSMSNPHVGLAMASVNGKLYLFGRPDQSTNGVTNVDIYDTASGAWSAGTTLTTAGLSGAAVAVNGMIYVFGGYSPTNTPLTTVEAYDPAANAWRAMAPMPTARVGFGAAALNGKIYLVGGYQNSTGGYVLPISVVEEFDPAAGATGSWTTKAPLSVPRSFVSVAGINGKLYATGGETGDGTQNPIGVNAVDAFTPQPGAGTWMAMAPYQCALDRNILAATATKIYTFGGGSYTSTRLDNVGEFDPAKGAKGEWNFGLSRLWAGATGSYNAATAVGSSVYVLGYDFQTNGAYLSTQLAKYTPPTALYCHVKN